jgi:hypothetical protein
MDFQTEKLQLIEELARMQDVRIVAQIKELLTKKAPAKTSEMHNRANSSLEDIAAKKVKSSTTFKIEFEQWKKKKRANLKS